MNDELHVYIDESGDLGKLGSPYFTIAALCTKNPKPLKNHIKRLKSRKLKKSIKKLTEIKANNSDNTIRKRVLKKIKNHECKICVVTIEKSKINDYLFDKKHKLYNYICGLLAENLVANTNLISITIDKKDGNQVLQKDLSQYLERKLKEKHPSAKIEVKHLESNCCHGLQTVDFVAWSANRKWSLNDSEFYEIIEPRVVSFRKFWD